MTLHVSRSLKKSIKNPLKSYVNELHVLLCNNKDFREEVSRYHLALTLTVTHDAPKNQPTAPPCGLVCMLQEGGHNVYE